MEKRGATIGTMRSLIDFSELSILSVSIVPVFRDFATEQGRCSERVAIVYGSTLALPQIRRIAAGESQYDFFRTRADAERWLTG